METTMTVQEQAMELHKAILYNYRMAAHHLVDAARGLKEMRDSKAYTSLGMATFEEYTEQMAGIKARQAYTYISTLERLGAPLMEEQAGLGITKLSLLAEITPVEREGFAAGHDLAGLTVKEVEALVEENNRRGEQLDMFAREQEQVALEMEAQQDVIRRLKAELEEERGKPPRTEQVTVSQPTEEKVLALQKELEAEREDKEKRMRAERMAADGDYRAVDIYFAQLQEAANRLLQLIATLRETDSEKGAKTGEALARYFEQMVSLCREGGEG